MLRRMFTCAGVFVALALAGCGGGGGSSSLPPLANVAAPGNSGAGAGGSAPSGGAAAGGSSGSTAAAAGAPSTISQTHVLTADYLGAGAGTNMSPTQAAPVLSWAEGDANNDGAISAAGIKTLDYLDPWRQATYDPVYSSDESTFSHDCSGNRIAIPISNTTQYLMNPSSSSLQTLVNNWEAHQAAAAHVDAFFFDDTDSLIDVPVTPCNVSQGSWDSATAAFVQNSSYPVVFNGYALNSDAGSLIDNSKVAGGMVEQCYGSIGPTAPYTTGSAWTLDENLELAAAAASRLFFCYNNPTSDAASSIAAREYIYASFLLTYGASSSVLWEYFQTPSGLHVFPESQIVPTNPLVSGVSSVSVLQASSGVYVREYGACFLAGKSVGPCAAVVNPDPSASHGLPSLKGTYAHTLALNGYGSLDGGTASVSGPAAPSSVPPATGLVLFR